MPSYLRVVLTLLLAAAGGTVFAWAELPAPWLSGSMVAVAAVVLMGFRGEVPGRLRDLVFVFLGISMGAGVTPEAVAQLGRWPLSMIALALLVAAVIAASSAYLRRVEGWDEPTAFFASVPGAMSHVMALTAASIADVRQVAMAQSFRVFILVALLPAAIQGTAPPPPPAPLSHSAALLEGPTALAVMLAASAVGALLLHRLRVPGGLLLGSMAASALLHAFAVVLIPLPQWLLIPGAVALGAVIGARFNGTDMALIRSTFRASLGSFVVAFVIAVAFSLAVAALLQLPLGQVLLAFAPGGLEAMTFMAFVMKLDPAYVGGHQLARFVGIALVLPLIARRHFRR